MAVNETRLAIIINQFQAEVESLAWKLVGAIFDEEVQRLKSKRCTQRKKRNP
jgi:hypothetical protein